MDPRAASLISVLDLAPHPEGGYYRQIYRSLSSVRPHDGRGERPALTTIFFLLPAGEVSCWHQVTSDEVWHFYEGAPLELLTADAGFRTVARHVLGTPTGQSTPVHVVPAFEWQAARSTGPYTLVGCTVGPGFDFADFRMLRDQPVTAALVRERQAAFSDFI
jgi:predicted cupin superfamily sugar epimerase